MASDTKNVKLGVCKVIYDGVDLGYTSGGVEVTVATQTHQVLVDQFGKTPINEYIMGRTVEAKCPLAETTIENMVAIMPGATLSTVGGAPATGNITIATEPVDGDYVTVNGIKVTFKTVPVADTDVAIGGAAAATATNLANYLSTTTIPEFGDASYSVATDVVTVTAKRDGLAGNAFTLASGQASVTVSGATLTGGTEPTSKSVDVSNGVGTNLLDVAKELRLHPVGKADTDRSDDFVIPRAATAGALKFSYMLEQERIFDTTFTGYADPTTGKLFTVGK